MKKQEKKINYKSKLVNYCTEGKGNAIVLLHGFVESSTMWDYFSTQLSQRFTVITIDLPGHGKTESFGESHTMELMANVVKSVLDHEGVNKCAMIGHSMGGYVSAEFANLFPGHLEGIGFFHSHVAGDNEEAKKNRDKTVELILRRPESFIRSFIPDLFDPENIETFKDEIENLKNGAIQMGTGAIVAALKGMKTRNDHEKLLQQLTCPVMFISGKKDVRIPVEKVLYQASLPKHCELLILDNVAHMGHIEAQEKTLAFVQSYCERLALPRP